MMQTIAQGKWLILALARRMRAHVRQLTAANSVEPQSGLMKCWSIYAVATALVGLSGCGGGSKDGDAFAAHASRLAITRQSLNVDLRRNALAASEVTTTDASALFNWAEIAYPGFFSSKRQNFTADPYVYRYYPETGNYIGVAGTGVWVLGPIAGSQTTPAYVGDLAEFRCSVHPTSCFESIDLQWKLTPTTPLVPGLVADPDPVLIQDGGLNSSFVLQVSRSGQPVAGDSIVWSTDDASGQVQFLSKISDKDGLVRAWYLAGGALEQTITARHVWSGKTTTLKLRRAAIPSPTVGRYASMYFRSLGGTYTATSISIIPRTAPERTYYSLSSIWQLDGQFAMYGGIQMLDCSVVSGPTGNPAAIAACGADKGKFRGRFAIFSSWDWKSPDGKVFKPILVNLPPTSSCQSFETEGNFFQCAAPLAWDINEEWRWTAEILPGAPSGYQRIRVTAASAARKISQEIATVDIAGKLSMDSFGAFDENWGGKESPSCLDVELRKYTVVSAGFWDGARWVKPNGAIAMGGLYSDTMTRCQNYAFTVTPAGLDIASGGKGLWITMADALVKDPISGLPVFPTNDQVLSQWQDLDLSTLVPVH
jgi:hypothetical protein